MGFDLGAELAAVRGQGYELHSKYLNPQLPRTLHTIGFDKDYVRGEGAYLYDAAGRRFLDASGGAAVSCLGHGDPEVTAAIVEQLGRLAYAHTSFFSSEPAEALADLLVGAAPAPLGRAMFVSSGSEAVEAAIKLARQFHVERGEPGRTRLIARRLPYAGRDAYQFDIHLQGPHETVFFDV